MYNVHPEPYTLPVNPTVEILNPEPMDQILATSPRAVAPFRSTVTLKRKHKKDSSTLQAQCDEDPWESRRAGLLKEGEQWVTQGATRTGFGLTMALGEANDSRAAADQSQASEPEKRAAVWTKHRGLRAAVQSKHCRCSSTCTSDDPKRRQIYVKYSGPNAAGCETRLWLHRLRLSHGSQKTRRMLWGSWTLLG